MFLQMAQNRERVTENAAWMNETLEMATKAVQNDGKIQAVGKSFNIPSSTLQEGISKGKTGDPKLGRNSVFTARQQQNLKKHVMLLAKMFHGLSPVQLRRIAFDFAEKNRIKHNFNRQNGTAGKDWLYNFLRRNPTVSVTKPEDISVNSILGFSQQEVAQFYKNVEKSMTKYKFPPTHIYNMDETGLLTFQEPGVILSPKGQTTIGSITSCERGKTVSVICAVSAAGSFVPPMFIYPQQRMTTVLGKDGPPGAIYKCSKSGCTNEELFMVWLQHFVQTVKPEPQNPVLLILDNHSSHVSLLSYQFCTENGIVMISIPPNSSHKLQPLDVTFYGPLKSAFYEECDLFMKARHMMKITPFDIAGVFNRAYSQVASIEKGVSGFQVTGIYPLNPNIFSSEDFLVPSVLQESSKVVSAVEKSNIIDQQQEALGISC
jgi:hypothetical protein